MVETANVEICFIMRGKQARKEREVTAYLTLWTRGRFEEDESCKLGRMPRILVFVSLDALVV